MNTTQKIKKSFISLISGLLLLTLALQVNYSLTYFLVFKLNQEKLSAAVCTKVIENCHACCYLNKKIAEEDSNNTKTTSRQILKLSEFVSISYSFSLSHTTEKEINFSYGSLSSLDGYPFIPEHPPNS